MLSYAVWFPQMREAERLLHACVDRETKLRRIRSWVELHLQRLGEWLRPVSQIQAGKALAELEVLKRQQDCYVTCCLRLYVVVVLRGNKSSGIFSKSSLVLCACLACMRTVCVCVCFSKTLLCLFGSVAAHRGEGEGAVCGAQGPQSSAGV